MTTVSDCGEGSGPPVTAGVKLSHASGLSAASAGPDRVKIPLAIQNSNRDLPIDSSFAFSFKQTGPGRQRQGGVSMR